jgi:hypothetical protein
MRTETDRILLRAASSGASLDDLAAIIRGNLTPECAAAVRAVTEALGKKAGPEDDRTEAKRFHDALQLACVAEGRLLVCGCLAVAGRWQLCGKLVSRNVGSGY